jgi:hypothetical protein
VSILATFLARRALSANQTHQYEARIEELADQYIDEHGRDWLEGKYSQSVSDAFS